MDLRAPGRFCLWSLTAGEHHSQIETGRREVLRQANLIDSVEQDIGCAPVTTASCSSLQEAPVALPRRSQICRGIVAAHPTLGQALDEHEATRNHH